MLIVFPGAEENRKHDCPSVKLNTSRILSEIRKQIKKENEKME